MPTPFIMPKMDMDQESVIINEWLKKEGEKIKKGEPLVVIETDKITSEVESPASGTVARFLYKENEEAPVSKAVAYILHDGETEADLPEQPKSETGVNIQESTLTKENVNKPATPVAKRMAEAEGIDLNQVSSSGEKITKEDVQSALGGMKRVNSRVEVSATPAARRISNENAVNLSQIDGTGPRGRVQASDVESFMVNRSGTQISSESTAIVGETVTLSNMRKRIAERLTASYQTTPHIYLTIEVDMSEAESSRKRLNELANKDGSPDISLTAYLLRTVSWNLKRHPFINASLLNNEIQLWEDINVGVATALENGLIVPVVHKADKYSVKELNDKLRYLTQRARQGELTHEEIQGGTFTISNLGMYGIHSFTAIINPPQSAILAVGTITRRPVVIDEDDTVDVRPMMMLTLAADHRIVDGAIAANFLADLVKALETPELLIF